MNRFVLLVGNIAVISVTFDNQTKLNESLDNGCNNRVLQVKLEKSTILVFGITHDYGIIQYRRYYAPDYARPSSHFSLQLLIPPVFSFQHCYIQSF